MSRFCTLSLVFWFGPTRETAFSGWYRRKRALQVQCFRPRDAFGPALGTDIALSTRHAGTRLVSRSQWIKRYDYRPLMRATACHRTRRERSSRRSPGRNPVAHPNAIARAMKPRPNGTRRRGLASRSTVVTARPRARRAVRARVWRVERRDALHERRDVSSGPFRAPGARIFPFAQFR